MDVRLSMRRAVLVPVVAFGICAFKLFLLIDGRPGGRGRDYLIGGEVCEGRVRWIVDCGAVKQGMMMYEDI